MTIGSNASGTTDRRFERTLGSAGVILLTLSVLSPAASVMVTGTDIVHQAGTGVILAFIFGAVITGVVTTMQAELGASFPVAGGDYATVGRVLGPFGGFLMFSMSVLPIPIFIALTSSGVAIYLHPLLPDLPAWPVTLATIASSVAISVLNVRTNAIITGAFLAVEVGALLLIAAVGFLHPAHSAFDLLTHPLRLDAAGHPMALGGSVLAVASVSAAFAVSGAGQAIYLSEEMKAPRTVGRLVMIILWLTVLLELAPVAGALVGAPDVQAVMQADAPFLTFISQAVSPLAAKAVGLAVAAAIFNAAVAGVVATSRVVYSTGRDRVWNGWTNRALLALHPRFNSPWFAAALTGLTAMAASLLSLNMLVILSASTAMAGNALLGLAVLRGRRSGLTGKVGYRAPWFPLTPILSIAIAFGMAIAQYNDPETGRPALLVTAATLLLASVYYRLVLNRRIGGWTLAGPADLD